jgi:DNA mismatch repair protein MutH
MLAPPRDLDELRARAGALVGQSLSALAVLAGAGAAAPSASTPSVRRKGKAGALVEMALGASGGSAAVCDFPELGVELKTIPVDDAGRPRESTYVCTLSLLDAERAEWATSWTRQKLAHVLWVPLLTRGRGDENPRVGAPLFWRPTAEQEDVLARDFDDAMGTIAIGGVEGLTARTGRWLQVRPKAATGRVRVRAYGGEGEWIATVPRGFYLRALFTGALLRDPNAVP